MNHHGENRDRSNKRPVVIYDLLELQNVVMNAESTCIFAEKIFDGKTHYIVGVALKQSEAGNDTSYYYHDSAIIEIATAAGLAKKATATRVGNLTSSNSLIMSVLLNIAKRNGQSGQSERNSLSDEDYMDAMEREDMETAARMVEEAAKDAGQIEIVRSKH